MRQASHIISKGFSVPKILYPALGKAPSLLLLSLSGIVIDNEVRCSRLRYTKTGRHLEPLCQTEKDLFKDTYLVHSSTDNGILFEAIRYIFILSG